MHSENLCVRRDERLLQAGAFTAGRQAKEGASGQHKNGKREATVSHELI
jgi:hypothetical protein